MRIFVNKSDDGLGVIAGCYAEPSEIAGRIGLVQTSLLAKGGGRDVDDYIAGLNAAVIVENDSFVMGFGNL